MPSLNLYQIPQVIQTTQAGAVGVNSATNKIDFDVSKNVTTEVEFLLKNIDRKLVIDPTIVLIIYIVNPQDNTLKLQRPLVPINQGRGHYRLSISPCDIADWDPGYYSYTMVVQRLDQSQILLHADQNRSQYGFLELKKGPLPSPIPVVKLHQIDFLPRFKVNPLLNYFESGAHPGSAQRDNRPGRHTCAIYTNNFSGKFKVQASLENGIPTDDHAWFDIENAELTLVASTGINSLEFVGSLMWVRFIITPDAIPLNGTVTQVLFKN